MWCLHLTFPELFWWWRLISSVFLTRTSCRRTPHANGYCGAWPEWVVSVSVLPLTLTESPPRLKSGLAIEAHIPSQAKEKAVGVWGFKEGGRQFTRRWEDQMIGKQMFAMPCKYVFLIKKLSLVIALSGTVLVTQSLQLFATPQTVAHQAPWSSPGKNTGVGCHFLLQGFLVQALYIILLGSSRRG